MPDKESTSDTPSTSNTVDLNSLANLSFGPTWADGKNTEKRSRKEFSGKNKFGNNRGTKTVKNDRRGQTKFRNNASGSSFSKNREFADHPRADFVPTFDIKIYPQDETFEALVKQLKGNFRTYQLFEITRLILEKSDRFICLINRIKKNSDNTEQPIYFTPKDSLPFDTEKEAISHYCEHYLEEFFDVKIVEVEPPKGSFNLIYRCPFTKKLIGPPNYHRFPDLLKTHHSTNIKNLSLEDYQNKLESLSEESVINEWLESTKQQKYYRIKKENTDNEEVKEFKTLEAARLHLVTSCKDTIVRSSTNYRFSGAKLESLPKSDLKLSILHSIEAQRRFPLDTANNIRGRLRRHKFTIYKKGSKGISYVCCVKRKFRDDTTVFTDSINELIAFVEKHQAISIQDLPYKFLSIPKPDTGSAKSENKSTEKQNIDGAEDDTTSKDLEAKDTNNPKKEEAVKVTEVIRNIRWLITEGYITEYSDGKLFVHPKADVSNSIKSAAKKVSDEKPTDAKESKETKEPEVKVESNQNQPLESNEEAVSKDEGKVKSCETPESAENKSTEKQENISETTVEKTEG
jgi:hypothetical protein